jgi:hypothetical protein
LREQAASSDQQPIAGGLTSHPILCSNVFR